MSVKDNIYWKLFKSTFLISAFTVGGGYVIVPLLKSTFVDKYKWLKEEETLDLVALAQSAPGVIAVNTSIILGYRLRGWRGAFTTIVATILPPLILLNIIAYFYDIFMNNMYIRLVLRGMQAAATAVILNVSWDMFKKLANSKDYIAISTAIVCFILGYFFSVNVMYLVAGAAILGMIFLRRV